MTIILRPYQQKMVADVYSAWAGGAQNVLLRADTGAGKTATLAFIHNDHPGASCIIAHRQELVGQLSLTLARYGLRHGLIAAENTKRAIARTHVEEFGQCYYTPGARCVVASVDTLIRATGLESWAAQVTLWTNDEAHHLVRDNKWCKAVSLFTNPNVRGLMPTATPKRADGKGLGREADGYADCIVSGPPMRWLIEQGYLTDYKIYCPPSDLIIEEEPGSSGDWSPTQLRKAAQRSHIVGDVVQHYLKWALGKKTLTFCTDIETAEETAQRFNSAGIPTKLLTGKTPDAERRLTIRQLERGDILNICAVDIISEGFDLPAVECVIMARPTHSLALYMQQFGRALRLLAGKAWAIIIDAVSNTVRMGGPPDKPRHWTLDRRARREKSDEGVIPIRVCIECFQPYEAIYRTCPFCGHYVEPESRSSPKAVAGDLEELDAETLARLRGEVDARDMDEWTFARQLADKFAQPAWVRTHTDLHRAARAAQATLRESMARWGGYYHALGETDSQIQRRFFFQFGLSVIEAMALTAAPAEALRTRVDEVVMNG